MEKLISIIAAALVLVSVCVSCSKIDPTNSSGGNSSASLAGTKWATSEQVGLGKFTLSFSASNCTLSLTNGDKSEICSYPYTFSNNQLKTKIKLSIWSAGQEQDATGTVNGNDMNFKLSGNGSNLIFSRK